MKTNKTVIKNLPDEDTMTNNKFTVNCAAPGCSKKVRTTRFELFFMKLGSLLRGGDFSAALFCPEHNERITAGRVDDGDPNTNPDLLKDQKKDQNDELVQLLKEATKKDS